jgi:hypothetical protein
MKAVHRENYPVRCLCTGESGFLTFNPCLDSDSRVCSQALLNIPCTAIDLYGDNIVIGTAASGIKAVPWVDVINFGCDVDNPADITSDVSDLYTTADGLLSDSIYNINAKGSYIAVVTSGGLSWQKDAGFINYATTSGNDVFVDFDGSTYLADGKSLRIKYGEPENFDAWDGVLEFVNEINTVFVESDEHGDSRAIFVGTEDGSYIIDGHNTESRIGITVSGSQNVVRVVSEAYSSFIKGHLFLASSNALNVYNIKTQQIDTVVWSQGGGEPLIAFDHVRLFSS